MEFKKRGNGCLQCRPAGLSTVVGGIVSYAQSTRNSVIAVANENFIVTAKAKRCIAEWCCLQTHFKKCIASDCDGAWNGAVRTDWWFGGYRKNI